MNAAGVVRHRVNAGYDQLSQTALSAVENATSRSGSRTGSPRSRNASTMANAVVTAAMPTASDPMAMQVNPTVRRSSRTA